MTTDELYDLDQSALNEYVWGRLRVDPRLEPPLESHFGDELPESFLIHAALTCDAPAFRDRLGLALLDSLRRLTVQQGIAPEGAAWGEQSDEHVARIAFVASRLRAVALVGPLYRFACAWLLDAERTRRLTSGQKHVIRTIAQLQEPYVLERFWQAMCERGPSNAQGLFFFGWARADADAAFGRLGRLVDLGEEIDLTTTIWSLIGQYGPGLQALGRAAASLSPGQRTAIRTALEEGGADQSMLRRFDAQAEPTPPADEIGQFVFDPDTEPRNRIAASRRPDWVPALSV